MKKVCTIIISLFILVGCSSQPKEEKTNETLENQNNSQQIYETVEIEASWAFDVSNPSVIIAETDYVVKVKVIEISETGEFRKDTDSALPSTPISVEVLEILKGDEHELSNLDTIRQWGGLVTIQEVIDISPIERVEKMELNKLTDEQKRTMYMEYQREGNYDFEVGEEYIVALVGNKEQGFYLGADGYCAFTQQKNTRATRSVTEEFENVLTKKTITLEEMVD